MEKIMNNVYVEDVEVENEVTTEETATAVVEEKESFWKKASKTIKEKAPKIGKAVLIGGAGILVGAAIGKMLGSKTKDEDEFYPYEGDNDDVIDVDYSDVTEEDATEVEV